MNILKPLIEKLRATHPNTFFMLVGVSFILSLVYLWCVVGGAYMLGDKYLSSGVLGVVLSFFVYGSIAINETRIGLLPDNKIGKLLSNCFGIGLVLYYINSYL